MILGIDLGASTTDFVLMDKFEILKKKSIKAVKMEALDKEIGKLKWPLEKLRLIAITGGKSADAPKTIFGIKAHKVNELQAISTGGLALASKRNALVVSLGTGTCIVSTRNNVFTHAGGTGIGGGTLIGLSKLLLGTTDLEKINVMALKGKSGNIDLLVKDVVGSGIGSLPGDATASNFAKLKKAKKEDLAAGIVNLIAEANAMVISLSSRESQQQNVVLLGKLLDVPAFKERLMECLSVLGRKPVVPHNYGIASAVGAAVFAQGI